MKKQKSPKTPASPEQIKKREKTAKIFFILVAIVYGIWFLLGIIGLVAPDTGLLWTIKDAVADRALNQITGFMMIATTFPFLINVAMCKKFDKKKIRLILIIVSVLCMAVCDVIFFTAFRPQLAATANGEHTNFIYAKLGDATTISISLFVSQIGLSFLGTARFTLGNTKGANIIQLVATVILTFIVFVAVGVAVTIAVIVIVFLIWKLITVLILASATEHKTYSVNDGGYERKLTYYGYDSVNSADEYVDDIGCHWITTDNGANFTKKQ